MDLLDGQGGKDSLGSDIGLYGTAGTVCPSDPYLCRAPSIYVIEYSPHEETLASVAYRLQK